MNEPNKFQDSVFKSIEVSRTTMPTLRGHLEDKDLASAERAGG